MTTIQDSYSIIQRELCRHPLIHLSRGNVISVISGRILALPCSFIDTLIDTAKTPLMAIEFVARAAFNTLQFFFSPNNYPIRITITYLDHALCNAVITPVAVVMAPVKFAYQFFKSFSDPENCYRELIAWPQPFFVDIKTKFNDKQVSMYRSFRATASAHPIMGRVMAVPLAFADVGLETLSTPLRAIEAAASAIINLLGMLFFNNCTLKQAVSNTNAALSLSAETVVALVICPLKLTYQVIANLTNPQTTYSTCNSRS
jgi:hypothetical protein